MADYLLLPLAGDEAATLLGSLDRARATFSWKWLGRSPGPPWETVDWDADPDWDWRTAADDTPEQLYALWHAAAARSRATVAGALAAGGLDQVSPNAGGPGMNLRRLLVDMIEEYARHAGHADLLRESVDGLVGEDPPDLGS